MKMITSKARTWPEWLLALWSLKAQCQTCRGTGEEACGCDGSNPDCFCKGTQKLPCEICGGSGRS